jgi:hypothetical protein
MYAVVGLNLRGCSRASGQRAEVLTRITCEARPSRKTGSVLRQERHFRLATFASRSHDQGRAVAQHNQQSE